MIKLLLIIAFLYSFISVASIQFSSEEEKFINNFIQQQELKFKLSPEQKKIIRMNFFYQIHPELKDNPLETIKPLYELGVGAFYTNFPDYPGASHNRTIILPFPSAIYRGDILQAKKDEGVRGRFFRRKKLELDISFDGTLPSDGKDNKEREGMPELDTLLEFGPKIRWKLIDSKSQYKIKFNVNLATRYAVSSDLNNTYGRGFSFNPFFELKFTNLFKRESILITTLNIKFATQKLQDYYYGVKEEFAKALRPRYQAKSGLMETSFAFAMYYPFKWDLWLFGGSILSYYKGARNINSPLHSKDLTISTIIGLYWNFHKSKYFVIEE